MFEQSTVTSGPRGKRAWTTFAGLASQLVLVSMAIMAPMVWPQVLPLAKLETSLAPPLPRGRQTAAEVKKVAPHESFVKAMPHFSLAAYQPVKVPDHITRLIEEQPEGFAVAGAISGGAVGAPDGIMVGILASIGDAARVAPPPVIEKAPAKPAAPVVQPIQRLPEGGRVHLGLVLHRSEPAYPPIAKSAHASGAVVLECVVGVDGRIHEVKVKSGNPLLVKAAVDAAWQWAYEPTQLNGVPIEIVTIMTFNFKLS
jgi:protein TonB